MQYQYRPMEFVVDLSAWFSLNLTNELPPVRRVVDGRKLDEFSFLPANCESEPLCSFHSSSFPSWVDESHFAVKGNAVKALEGFPKRLVKAFPRKHKASDPLSSGSKILIRALLISCFSSCSETMSTLNSLQNGRRFYNWRCAKNTTGLLGNKKQSEYTLLQQINHTAE